MVVLTGLLQLAENVACLLQQAIGLLSPSGSRRTEVPGDQRVVHHGVLPDRLTAESLLMTHVAVGASFRSTLAITCSDIPAVQTGRIMRAVIIMSRPK